jgi:hypothetical protein
MKYSCRYKNNPSFPYNQPKTSSKTDYKEKKENFSDKESSLFNSFLSPIEAFLGRKVEFEDILLLIIIYIVFTEKEKENNTLLLCLLFVLLN